MSILESVERLPVAVRLVGAGALMALATAADLAFVAKTSPARVDVVVAAALGVLAAWPFRWRARTRVARAAIVAAIVAFAVVMVWARVTGRLHSSFAFIFSVLLISIPVQRARGA